MARRKVASSLGSSTDPQIGARAACHITEMEEKTNLWNLRNLCIPVVAGAGLIVPPLPVVGGVGGLVALLTGAGTLVPIVQAWQFSRRQDGLRDG